MQRKKQFLDFLFGRKKLRTIVFFYDKAKDVSNDKIEEKKT